MGSSLYSAELSSGVLKILYFTKNVSTFIIMCVWLHYQGVPSPPGAQCSSTVYSKARGGRTEKGPHSSSSPASQLKGSTTCSSGFCGAFVSHHRSRTQNGCKGTQSCALAFLCGSYSHSNEKTCWFVSIVLIRHNHESYFPSPFNLHSFSSFIRDTVLPSPCNLFKMGISHLHLKPSQRAAQ